MRPSSASVGRSTGNGRTAPASTPANSAGHRANPLGLVEVIRDALIAAVRAGSLSDDEEAVLVILMADTFEAVEALKVLA